MQSSSAGPSSTSAQDVRAEARKLISKFSPDALEDLRSRLTKMIDYAIGRVDYYEQLRTRYQSMGVGIFGGGVAFASLVVSGASHLGAAALVVLLLAAGALMVTGIFLIRKYNETSASNRYYREFADIRSWYYKYTVGEGRIESVDDSIRAFSDFVSSWHDFANEDNRFLVEDLEQVFILYRLQDWKRTTVQEMKEKLEFGLAFAFMFLVLGAIFTVVHLY